MPEGETGIRTASKQEQSGLCPVGSDFNVVWSRGSTCLISDYGSGCWVKSEVFALGGGRHPANGSAPQKFLSG